MLDVASGTAPVCDPLPVTNGPETQIQECGVGISTEKRRKKHETQYPGAFPNCNGWQINVPYLDVLPNSQVDLFQHGFCYPGRSPGSRWPKSPSRSSGRFYHHSIRLLPSKLRQPPGERGCFAAG